MKKSVLHTKVMMIMFVMVLLSGCSWLYQSHQPKDEGETIVDMTPENLEVPPFEFMNQFGETSSTEEFKGQVWLSNMIFVRCPTVCNTMTPNMMLLQKEIMKENLDVKLVSFTVDPDFDTPEQLKRYGESYNADFNHWTFVTGYTYEEITDFAATAFQSLVLEIENSDDMIHGTNFYLIDEEGKVIRKYDGLNLDEKEVIEDIKKFLN